MSPLQILFIRHGESTYASLGRYTGTTDIPLTRMGHRQALAVGSWLGCWYPPATILCSPMLRTRQTHDEVLCGAAAAGCGALPDTIFDARLAEICYGRWEGMTREEIVHGDSERYHAWEADPVRWPAGGSGETAAEVRDRVQTAIQEYALSGTVWVVTHRTVMRIMMATLLDTPLAGYRSRYEQNLASINGFARNEDGSWKLLFANLTPWRS